VLVVCGEAVLDLVSDGSPHGYQALPGGSPVNVAVGAARLGVPTCLLARFGSGRFGEMLRAHVVDAGVNLSLSVMAEEPATLAVVSLDPTGSPSYDFYVDGTAEAAWARADFPDQLPTEARALHIGSIASWRAPAAGLIADLVVRENQRGAVLISFDPNLRPALVDDPGASKARVERMLGLAHLIKTSAEDLRWLYPFEDPDAAAQRWAQLGPALVVLTDGARSVRAYRPSRSIAAVPTRRVRVVDTVGAGDAFNAGLLVALAERDRLSPDGLANLDDPSLEAVLRSAVAVAAITCARRGADPPSRDERDRALAASGSR